MSRTKELTNVPGITEGSVVVIKKLKFGDMTKLRSKMMNINIGAKGADASVDTDPGEYQKWLVVYGLKEAPFLSPNAPKEEIVENLDAETGDFLFAEIQEFNNLSNEDVEVMRKK